MQVTARVLVMGLLGACMFVVAGLVLAADSAIAPVLRVVWLVVAAMGAAAIVFYVRRLLAMRRH